MTAEQLQTAQKFADMFVYMAQQVFGGYPPAERKAIVTEALKNALICDLVVLSVFAKVFCFRFPEIKAVCDA